MRKIVVVVTSLLTLFSVLVLLRIVATPGPGLSETYLYVYEVDRLAISVRRCDGALAVHLEDHRGGLLSLYASAPGRYVYSTRTTREQREDNRRWLIGTAEGEVRP